MTGMTKMTGVTEKNEVIEVIKTGFSIEGGTRRLIAAYFGIYSCLLCV